MAEEIVYPTRLNPAERAARDADEAEWEKRMDDFMLARQAVVTKTQGCRGVSGAIDCPVCNTGVLTYAVMRNGHIHGRCSTADCVDWLE